MRCFFFGDAGRQLYGALHTAGSVALTRNTAVVLAYPWLSEYNGCHTAFRKLANLLEREGFPTLRFDYSGTGDSEGAPTEGFAQHWTADIATACRELNALSRARSLCVVGLGLGATLAVQAASLASLDQLVLWEPVVSGTRYLDQLDLLDRRLRMARLSPPSAAREQRDQLLGFAFPPAARSALAGLDVRNMTVPPGTTVSVVAPTSWPELPALTRQFPSAHLELFAREETPLEATEAMLSMEPLHAIVRSVIRGELA
jgi:pimeloyl-ACP methyl ester carboxylesterase